MFWTGIGIVAVVVLIMLVFNRRALGRIVGAGQAQVDKFGRAIGNVDPLALYQKKIEDEVERLGGYKTSLEKIKANARGLNRQIEQDTIRKTQLESRIQTALSGSNDKAAREYALQLQHVEEQLEANNAQLTTTQGMYDNFLKQVQASERNINDARQDARNLGIQLEQSKAEKEMASFAQEFQGMSRNLDDLADLKGKVLSQIDANRAAVDVAADTGEDVQNGNGNAGTRTANQSRFYPRPLQETRCPGPGCIEPGIELGILNASRFNLLAFRIPGISIFDVFSATLWHRNINTSSGMSDFILLIKQCVQCKFDKSAFPPRLLGII